MNDEDAKSQATQLRAGKYSMRCALVFALMGLFSVFWKAIGGGIGGRGIMTFLPALILLPTFFLGNANAFRALFSTIAAVKRQGKVALIIIWSALLLMVIGGEFAKPTAKRISGVYHGSYESVSESLELFLNGTFIQGLSLPSGVVSNRGDWKIIGGVVELRSYYEFIEPITHRVINPPTLYSITSYELAPKMLIRDWGSGYYVLEKQ